MTASWDNEWPRMKVTLAKVIHRGKYTEARDFLQDVFRDFEHPPRREGELVGMLYVLDILAVGD